MKNTLIKTTQVLALAILCLAPTAKMAFGQFPTKSPAESALAGNWKVTNMADVSIDIQISPANQFRMSVDGNESVGELTLTNDIAVLKFANGNQQQFKVERNGNNLSFQSVDGQQTFLMTNASDPSARQQGGFPVVNSTEKDTPASLQERVIGTWYGKMEGEEQGQRVTVFIKSEFRPDGTYQTSMIFTAGEHKDTNKDEGRWTVQGNNLVSASHESTVQEVAPIQFNGSDLIVDMTKELGSKLSLSRQSSQVKTSQLNVRRLIEYAQSLTPGSGGSDQAYDQEDGYGF